MRYMPISILYMDDMYMRYIPVYMFLAEEVESRHCPLRGRYQIHTGSSLCTGYFRVGCNGTSVLDILSSCSSKPGMLTTELFLYVYQLCFKIVFSWYMEYMYKTLFSVRYRFGDECWYRRTENNDICIFSHANTNLTTFYRYHWLSMSFSKSCSMGLYQNCS